MTYFFLAILAILLFLSSVFMILLILVQRGRGGGITGALGGAGGQSAFGSKAGDVFTRITIGTAVVWIFLSMITISIFNPPEQKISLEDDSPSIESGMGDELTDPPADDGPLPGVTDQPSEPLPGEGNGSQPETPKTDGQANPQPTDPGLNPPQAPADTDQSGEAAKGNSTPATETPPSADAAPTEKSPGGGL